VSGAMVRVTSPEVTVPPVAPSGSSGPAGGVARERQGLGQAGDAVARRGERDIHRRVIGAPVGLHGVDGDLDPVADVDAERAVGGGGGDEARGAADGDGATGEGGLRRGR
jgi:hypothetical protein